MFDDPRRHGEKLAGASAAWGCSESGGIRGGTHRLRVSVGGVVVHEADVPMKTPFASLVARGPGAPLPAAVVGEEREEHVVCPRTSLRGPVEVRLGDSLMLKTTSSSDGEGTVRVTRTLARDVARAMLVHETIDVTLDVGDAASVTAPPAGIDGGWIHGDRLGFALCHPDFFDRLRELAAPSQSALDFLTTDARADELLEQGLLVPFLGVRPLWPSRVLLQSGATTAPPLPLGQRVALKRRLALAPAERYGVLLGEALAGPRDALQPSGSWNHTGGGAYELAAFVAGGELATFVLRKVADVVAGAVEPLVNVAVHAMWKDPRAAEPLAVVP
jgi:hypothetical protein